MASDTSGHGNFRPSYQDFKSQAMNKECIVEVQIQFFFKKKSNLKNKPKT